MYYRRMNKGIVVSVMHLQVIYIKIKLINFRLNLTS